MYLFSNMAEFCFGIVLKLAYTFACKITKNIWHMQVFLQKIVWRVSGLVGIWWQMPSRTNKEYITNNQRSCSSRRSHRLSASRSLKRLLPPLFGRTIATLAVLPRECGWLYLPEINTRNLVSANNLVHNYPRWPQKIYMRIVGIVRILTFLTFLSAFFL